MPTNRGKSRQFKSCNRNHWRNWLAKHHADETEIWLVFIKKHTGKANLSYDDAVEEALCFGWIDGIKRSLEADTYMHRYTPRKPGNRTIEEARASGGWQSPVSRPPEITMPQEFGERLKTNDKAATFFASLAPSYRREYVAWVASAKRAGTRQRRLDEAIDRLEHGLEPGMR